MKKLLTFGALLWATFSCAQHEEHSDSLEVSGFRPERTDTITNEKFEIALGTDKSIVMANQTHYQTDYNITGRFFSLVSIEKNEEGKMEFFTDFMLDLTLGKCPAHLAIGCGDDQVERISNVFFVGPGATVYWSDIKPVHTYLHIFRTSASYIWFPNAETEEASIPAHEASSYRLEPQMEYTVFAQLQPWHMTHNCALFFETFSRFRRDANVMDFEIGIRHHKVSHGHLGFGLRAEMEDMQFSRIAGILRINFGQGNPRHVKLADV